MGNTHSSGESAENKKIIDEALADLSNKFQNPNKKWAGVRPQNYVQLHYQNELNKKILQASPANDPYSNPQLQGAQIMNDNRSRVSQKMLNQHPYLPIGFITMTFDSVSTSYGSGVAITPNVVLTCAHNCWCKDRQKEAKNMHFILHVNGRSGQSIEVIKMIYPQEFQHIYRAENDYAILILKQPVDRKFGYLAVNYGISESPLEVKIVGFPYKIKYNGKVHQGDKIMFEADGIAIIKDQERRIIQYSAIATSKGQSGGPILRHIGYGEYEVIGVHLGQNDNKTANFGLLMGLKHYTQYQKLSSKKVSIGAYNFKEFNISEIQTLKKMNHESLSLKRSLLHLKDNQKEQVIAAIKSNHNIMELDLSMNQLRGLKASGFNTNLVILNLNYNRVTRNFIDQMNKYTWPNLKIFSIHRNQVQNDETTTIKSSKFPSLETLIMSQNILTWEFLLNIGKENHKNLTNLYLGGNEYLFVQDPRNLEECKFPELSNLGLGWTGIKSVNTVKELAKMKTPVLYELDLSNNQMTAQMVAQLKPFANIISSLNLNSNKLKKQGIINLIIGQFSGLRSLHLSNNDINDSALQNLAGGKFFPELEILSLDGNEITSNGLTKLLKNGKNLQYVKARANNLDGFNPNNYNFKIMTEMKRLN